MAANKVIASITFTALLVGSISAAPVQVGDNWDESVHVGECAVDESPVVDVNQEVVDEADRSSSGEWAQVNYTRHIRVWEMSDQKYCAVVEHEGRFQAIEGASSPAGNGQLTGKEQGTMQGGYRAIVTGSEIKESPEMSRKGSAEPVQNGCLGPSSECQKEALWTEAYFEPGYQQRYDWWAWIYDSGRCGKWVDRQYNDEGDVHCG